MYPAILSSRGFIIPEAVMRRKLGQRAYDAQLRALTITTPQKIGPPKVITLYSTRLIGGAPCLVLPRTLAAQDALGRLFTITVCFPPPRTITVQAAPLLYANQTVVVDYLMAHVYTEARIAAGTASALLDLRAGMGKTYVAAGLIARLRLRTLYVVPTCILADQCVRDMSQLYGAGGPKVGLYSNGPQHVGTQDITVIVINSAMKCAAEFYEQYSMIVLDEAHTYCTQERKGVFERCALAVLGISATLHERGDGFDPVAHRALAFDGIVRAAEIPGFTYDNVEFDCTARIVHYRGPPEYSRNLVHENTGEIFTHYMYGQFISDRCRLQLALDELVQLYDWRGEAGQMHYIYVFAEEVEILRKAYYAFADLLRGRRDDIVADMAPDDGLEMFTGGMRSGEIAAAVANARVLFSTYSYAGTGVSILKMSAMLLLTPRKAAIKQIVARILRRGSDPTIPRIVVDIVDSGTCLARQIRVRSEAYDAYGFKKIVVKKKYKDIALGGAPVQDTVLSVGADGPQ